MSADWTHGYVTDAIYTDSFFRELAPAWLNYVAVLNGTEPVALDRPFTYLELGCGLGRSTAILAASNPNGRFIGIDFNPAHVAIARSYAEKMDIRNVEYLEKSFTESQPGELPECDMVVVHGVYSWVDEGARAGIRRILRHHVKPGGLVYISYNALPGWSSLAPIRKLMQEVSISAGGETLEGLSRALDVMEKVAAENFRYFGSTPNAIVEATQIKGRDKNYLAHEFLNAEWNPFYGIDVANDMAEAKLTYVGSATLIENHLDMLLDESTQQVLREQKSTRVRSLLVDFAVNQRFRRDVFVRGHQQLSAVKKAAALDAVILGPQIEESEITQTFRCGRKQVAVPQNAFARFKEAVLEQPHRIADFKRIFADCGVNAVIAERVLLLMVAAGKLMPYVTLPEPRKEASKGRLAIVDKQTNLVVECALSSRTRQYAASRVVGSGISLEVTDAAMMIVSTRDAVGEADIGQNLLSCLSQNGIRFNLRPSEGGETPSEIEHATEVARRYLSEKLPNLISAGILI